MKIVVDMNASPIWVKVLAPRGHDVIHWSQVGRQDDPDERIMGWARDNGRVVLTNDLDFGEILAITGGLAPSVIQLRTGRNDPIALAPLVSGALEKCRKELEAGALISVDHLSHRVKLLPLKPE